MREIMSPSRAYFGGSLILVLSGAYPEIFWGRGFEIFFVWTGNFRGGFKIFLLKTPSKLEKFPKKGRGFDPQNPSLNTPLSFVKLKVKQEFLVPRD